MFKQNEKWKKEYEKLEKSYMESLRREQLLQNELQQLRRYRQEEKKSREDVTMLHEQARRLKHDMRNHLMVLASYLNQNKIEEAKDYTSSILGKFNLDYSYISTGNSLLNYIVNQKLNLAKQKKIYVKAEIENLKFEGIQSIDFSAILGNLLDNAIEAASNSKKRYVEIAIRQRRGYEMIQICNSIDVSVLKNNPLLKTTKSDEKLHGIGVLQVRELVEKYDGILDIYEEENRFIVSVLL